MKPLLTLLLGLLGGLFSATAQLPAWQGEVENLKQLLATAPAQADEAASRLLKGKNRKDVALLTVLARTYWEAGRTAESDDYLAQARKADAKYAPLSVLEGDIALQQGNIGAACQLYEQAIYFDPQCREAYLKYAAAYRNAAPQLAIEKLLQLKQLVPHCPEADRSLAELYYGINRFGNAIEAYSRFIDTPDATEADLLKYAFALFLNHDFERSLAAARRGLEHHPQHAPFHRLVLYNNVDLHRYDEAEQTARSLFSLLPDEELSYLDHRYYGVLLAARQNYEPAIDHFRTALQKDSTQTALWLNLSDAYEQQEAYPQAIAAYRNYYEALPPEEQTPEQLFQLGRLYYGMGTAAVGDTVSVQPMDSLQCRSALCVADSLFTLVGTLVPDSYLGPLWRARANSALDPETTDGLAKPHYEAVVALLLPRQEVRYNSALVECYSYLGYYYLLKGEYASSRSYWEKILLLDPNNGTATKALSGMKS